MADAIRDSIVVNEILPQPVSPGGGFDTDGNGTVSALDEYVEFYNTGPDPVDLGGLQLWDPGTGHWFTFPPDSILEPGGHAIVVVGVQPGGSLPPVPPGSLAFDAGRGTAVLNNPGDVVFVYDPDTGEYIAAAYGNWPLIDPNDPSTWGDAPSSTAGLAGFPPDATLIGEGEEWGPLIPGESIQRVPDGGDSFNNTSGSTPGSENICFVAGTRILTPSGEVAVERIRPGDLVITADRGAQPVRWVGFTRRPARGALAPIRIRAGVLGNRRDLWVSPQHRMLLAGWQAELLFSAPEVLVAAKALVDGAGVCRVTGGNVSYVHLMFDRHEIVWAEGAPSESFYPGAQAMSALDREVRDELFALFPCLRDAAGAGYGAFARPVLRRHEGQVLHAAITAATATGAAHAATAAHTGRRPGDAGAVAAGPARGAQAGQDDRTRLHA